MLSQLLCVEVLSLYHHKNTLFFLNLRQSKEVLSKDLSYLVGSKDGLDDKDILGDRLKEQLIQLWEILKLRMRNKLEQLWG